MTTNQVSFLNKAMELCNSMMQFSGCELLSNNTRTLLEGLRHVAVTMAAKEESVVCADLIHSVDLLLEEVGIAEAEADAYRDDKYEDSDEYYEDCLYDYPDPMNSAEEAFEWLALEGFHEYEALESEALFYESLESEAKHEEDMEIDDWADAPHDELNQELKDTLKAIEDSKIDRAIWRARELMMNKIVFGIDDSYPVHHVSFEVDENGVPVDIVISTRLEYLKYIAENHCQLGFNCTDEEQHGFHTALYGRLDNFSLYDPHGNLLWSYKRPAFSF